jgi:hypothetical protein
LHAVEDAPDIVVRPADHLLRRLDGGAEEDVAHARILAAREVEIHREIAQPGFEDILMPVAALHDEQVSRPQLHRDVVEQATIGPLLRED